MYKKNQSTIPETQQNQWFETWFNTPFYHLLYNKRDYKEAETFISNLLQYLNPPLNSKVLDLACGAGRHSVTLNKAGLDVLGTDLSNHSIEEAKQFENPGLHFEVHDMREVICVNRFDYIFNLFTSFGYFDTLEDDENVLFACHQQLKNEGVFVLDYFNVAKIVRLLPYTGKEIRDQLIFSIEKSYTGTHILKSIRFECEGKQFNFEEKVAAYTLNDLRTMFDRCGFEIKAVFGNYLLDAFREDSDRVIIVAEKKIKS